MMRDARKGKRKVDNQGNDQLAKFVREFQATMQCGVCLGLLDKPVTLACAHSFCSSCFEDEQFPPDCPTCRRPIPRTRAYAPAINTGLEHLIAQVREINRGHDV